MTSHWSNPTHRKQTPHLRGTTTFQPAERAHQTQQSEQSEKADKYSADEEHDKTPPNQTKEEIGSLPEKESRIMIAKMIKNLQNKIDLQINRLETRTEKMQEMFNKDLEEIKSQSIINNAITEIKNTLGGTKSRITEAEESISEVEDRIVEINEAEMKK